MSLGTKGIINKDEAFGGKCTYVKQGGNNVKVQAKLVTNLKLQNKNYFKKHMHCNCEPNTFCMLV